MANASTLFQLEAATAYMKEGVSGAIRVLRSTAGVYEAPGDGLTVFRNAVTNTSQVVKASAGKVYGVIVQPGATTGTGFVALYNIASASVTVGTSEFIMLIPFTTGNDVFVPLVPGNDAGIFGTAIAVSAQTTSRGSTAITTPPTVTILYA